MNEVTLLGHVLEAPKLRQSSCQSVATFPLATPRGLDPKADPRSPRFDLHCVKVVGELAEALPALEHGSSVLVRGTLRSEFTRGNGFLVHRSIVRASEIETNPPDCALPLEAYLPTFQVLLVDLSAAAD